MKLTPAQERALLKRVRLGIQKDLGDATAQLQALIRKGMAPRDAVDQVFGRFASDYGRIYQQAMFQVDAPDAQAQAVNLSRNLYNQKAKVSTAVERAIRKHVAGYQDARKLARQLYEGYDAEAESILKIKASNQKLPKDMREAVLNSGDTASLKRSFARLQAKGLKTKALDAAYRDVLKTIDSVETGAGRELLNKKIKVAFYEKGRFLANRVAQTELHRVYSVQRATEVLNDDDVHFVQIRRSGNSNTQCICDQIVSADLHGMGAGVYPKKQAPVPPYHPFCRCVIAPRLDLTGKTSKRSKPAAFIDEVNRSIDPLYKIKTIEQAVL